MTALTSKVSNQGSQNSPLASGDIIFSQPVLLGDESWHAYTSAIGSSFAYVCADDFSGLSGSIGSIQVFGLDLIYASGWYAGDPTGQTFEVKFYNDNGGVPGDVVATYSGLTPEFVDMGPYSWAEGYSWTIELPSAIAMDQGWVSVQSTGAPDGSVFLWLDSYTGNVNAMQQNAGVWGGLGDNLAFNLIEGGVAPPDDVRIVSIDQPVSGQANVFTPTFTMKNVGNNSETLNAEFNIKREVPPTPQVTLMSDGFESGYFNGWSAYDMSGDGYNWYVTSYPVSYPYHYAHTGTYMACYDSYDAPSGDSAALIYDTPFDLSSVSNCQMSFWMYHYYTSDYIWAVASMDGSTFYIMGTFTNSGYDWAQHTVDLSYFAGSPNVWVGFWANSEWGYGMSIDDVQVVIPPTTSPPVTEYDQIVPVTIASGTTQQVTFPTWTPAAFGVEQNADHTYDLTASAPLAGDASPGNNVKTGTIGLHFPWFHDIQVDTVLSPTTSGPAQTQSVSLQISNQGQNAERNFFVDAQIGTVVTGTPLYSEDFSAGVIPAGWVASGPYTTNWMISYTNNAGGASPELEFNYYPSATGTFRMMTAPIDTSSVSAGQLTFNEYINDYNGQYTLDILSTTDGGAHWNTVWSRAGGPQPAETVTVPLPGCGSANLQLAFELVGNSYNINYWYLDNIIIKGAALVPEYDESAAVAAWLQPGETMTLTYPDWTPANLIAPQTSGTFTYACVGTSQLPTDTNPANNKASSSFTLTYIHDVTVKKITSPSDGKGRDVIFSQPVLTGDESWGAYTSAIGPSFAYVCADDFSGLTASIGSIQVFGLDLIYASGWLPGNPAGATFEVKFYNDNGGMPGDVVQTFSGLTPPDFIDLGPYSWAEGYSWVIDLPSSVALDHGWVSVQSTSIPDGSVFLWLDSYTGNVNAMQENGGVWGGLGDNLAFNLSSGGGHGPGTPSVFVKQGATAPVGAIVNNVGTFQQNDLTAGAIIYDYTADPNGTEVYNNSIGSINLAPSAEQTLSYPTYTYANEGVYGLTVNIPVANDDKQGNNQKTVYIGSDGTPPVTTSAVSPAAPDGANGWYVSNVKVTLTSTDAMSGVGPIMYVVDGGTPALYSGPVTISTDGNHTFGYYAIDKVGNQETTHTVSFHIDKTVPYVVLNKEIQIKKIVYTVQAQDNMSGLDRVEWWIGPYPQNTTTFADKSGVQSATWILSPIPNINVSIEARVFDLAGNHISQFAGALSQHLIVGQSESLPQQ